MSVMINPNHEMPATLNTFFASLIKNRQLIYQMSKREVIGRYKGSIMGLTWSLFNPVLMLIIYTFVFSVVFKAKWGSIGGESNTQFALILFVGMIVFGLFSEAINRAPSLILGNVNYVKKVVFPLEILPIISLGASLFHALISMFVLIVVFTIFNGQLHWTIIFLPLIITPLLMFALGLSWILASLGVYLRDVGQIIGTLTSILMFLSPVFYPIEALPVKFQPWMIFNPLSFVIEESRNVVILGVIPDWRGLFSYVLFALVFMQIGYFWFQKTRKGFSDVL